MRPWPVFTFCFLGCLLTVADAGQMCWVCKYQSGGFGQQCVASPANWTAGQPDRLCDTPCMTEARYNGDGKLIIVSRGCSQTNESRSSGCNKIAGIEICYFSCGAGTKADDYCNDQAVQTSRDPNGAMLMVTPTWTALLLLVAIATGCL